jgi:formyl-CoA transferase
LSALHARQTSGHGYAIDVALIDCAAASMVNVLQAHLTSGKAPARVGNAHLQIVPYELFRTADGWLVLAVGNDRQWRAFCGAAGRSEWAGDARFTGNADRVRNREVLVPLIGAAMVGRTSGEWQRALDAVGVPNGPVWSVAELMKSELARERRLTITAKRPDGTPVELVRSPLVDDMPDAVAPPALGADTEAVLRGVLGYGDEKIAALRREGAV